MTLQPDSGSTGGKGPDLVESAIAHFGLDVAHIDTGDDSYSSTVRLLTLTSSDRVVLKIPWSRRKLHREVGALRALQHDMPVPAVLDVWDPGDDDNRPGAMLLSCLPGSVIRDPVTIDLARQMGVLLARLHLHPRDHFGDESEARHGPAGWWELLHRSHESWQPYCERVLPPAFWQKARDLYEDLYADLPAPDGPCWVHSDYRPGNILATWDATQAQITGLIDFESARGGSADYDFVKVSHYVWDVVPGTRDAFCAGYASVRPLPDIDRTLPLYRLHNAIGGVAWCVRRTNTRDPFYSENLAVIETMLGERGEPLKRIQFWGAHPHDDHLIREILSGEKTSTVCKASEYHLPDGDYDTGNWQPGDLVEVYDLQGVLRCHIRITEVYNVSFGDIPEKLWRGEVCRDAEHFREAHRICWPNEALTPDFEMTATHFELVDVVPV